MWRTLLYYYWAHAALGDWIEIPQSPLKSHSNRIITSNIKTFEDITQANRFEDFIMNSVTRTAVHQNRKDTALPKQNNLNSITQLNESENLNGIVRRTDINFYKPEEENFRNANSNQKKSTNRNQVFKATVTSSLSGLEVNSNAEIRRGSVEKLTTSKEEEPNDDISNGSNTQTTPTPATADLPKDKIDKTVKTFSNIIKVLKFVQTLISKTTHKTLKGKLEYLRQLKNQIMMNINTRIDAIWPDDDKRIRRSHKGDVDFPSAEGALMTISFLTFAVFLIKLIMQVITTYKSKTMMFTPVLAAMGKNRAKTEL